MHTKTIDTKNTTPISLPPDYDASAFPRPSVTVDIALLTVRDRSLQVLLIRRKEAPYAGQWALPGGFVRENESLEAAARRELAEETGVAEVLLEQLHAFSDPERDPRAWVITVAYTALVASDALILRADTDASEAAWFGLEHLPQPLAFDHPMILDYAIASLRRRLETELKIAAALLPKRFTLTQVQEIYEILLNRPFDKRNFRKWLLATGSLIPTDQEQRGRHRPALLYEFVTNSPSFLR